jgi:hypothetical protein
MQFHADRLAAVPALLALFRSRPIWPIIGVVGFRSSCTAIEMKSSRAFTSLRNAAFSSRD